MKLIVMLLVGVLICGNVIPARAETGTEIGTFAVYVGYDYDTDGDTIHDPVGSGIPVSIYRNGQLYTRVYTNQESIAIAELEEAHLYEVFVFCGFTENGKEMWTTKHIIQFWPIGVVEWECELKPAEQTHLPSLFSD